MRFLKWPEFTNRWMWLCPALAVVIAAAVLWSFGFAWWSALLAALLLFQALNWFGSEPEHAGASFSATAFLAFGILTALAFWVQSTRWHKNHVGLAVGSVQR